MAVINPTTFTTADGRTWAAHHTNRPFLAAPSGGRREHFATLDAARRHATAAAAGRGFRVFFDYAPGEGVLAEECPPAE